MIVVISLSDKIPVSLKVYWCGICMVKGRFNFMSLIFSFVFLLIYLESFVKQN